MPSNTDIDMVQPLWKQHRMKFCPITNQHIMSILSPGTHYGTVTTGPCDCGTVLGCAAVDDDPGIDWERRLQKDARKLRKKNWSEAKISRWLEEKKGARQRRKQNDLQRINDRRPEAEDWCQLLRDILRSGHCESVGILLHWYSGSLEDEPKQFGRLQKVSIDDVTPDLIMEMREDVMVEFHATSGSKRRQ